ncbi:hypothetical protein CVT26_001280 [Gymnopilus dilepis]|uniref:Uncharacterized protein n=1 Tax=Gymnopilus dilepis TaxID=231916 RepID=A0A409Y220_9AGAR|nr:hypothetical protein CVT26_001280 [Gymnopilus dilepis]
MYLGLLNLDNFRCSGFLLSNRSTHFGLSFHSFDRCLGFLNGPPNVGDSSRCFLDGLRLLDDVLGYLSLSSVHCFGSFLFLHDRSGDFLNGLHFLGSWQNFITCLDDLRTNSSSRDRSILLVHLDSCHDFLNGLNLFDSGCGFLGRLHDLGSGSRGLRLNCFLFLSSGRHYFRRLFLLWDGSLDLDDLWGRCGLGYLRRCLILCFSKDSLRFLGGLDDLEDSLSRRRSLFNFDLFRLLFLDWLSNLSRNLRDSFLNYDALLDRFLFDRLDDLGCRSSFFDLDPLFLLLFGWLDNLCKGSRSRRSFLNFDRLFHFLYIDWLNDPSNRLCHSFDFRVFLDGLDELSHNLGCRCFFDFDLLLHFLLLLGRFSDVSYTLWSRCSFDICLLFGALDLGKNLGSRCSFLDLHLLWLLLFQRLNDRRCKGGLLRFLLLLDRLDDVSDNLRSRLRRKRSFLDLRLDCLLLIHMLDNFRCCSDLFDIDFFLCLLLLGRFNAFRNSLWRRCNLDCILFGGLDLGKNLGSGCGFLDLRFLLFQRLDDRNCKRGLFYLFLLLDRFNDVGHNLRSRWSRRNFLSLCLLSLLLLHIVDDFKRWRGLFDDDFLVLLLFDGFNDLSDSLSHRSGFLSGRLGDLCSIRCGNSLFDLLCNLLDLNLFHCFFLDRLGDLRFTFGRGYLYLDLVFGGLDDIGNDLSFRASFFDLSLPDRFLLDRFDGHDNSSRSSFLDCNLLYSLLFGRLDDLTRLRCGNSFFDLLVSGLDDLRDDLRTRRGRSFFSLDFLLLFDRLDLRLNDLSDDLGSRCSFVNLEFLPFLLFHGLNNLGCKRSLLDFFLFFDRSDDLGHNLSSRCSFNLRNRSFLNLSLFCLLLFHRLDNLRYCGGFFDCDFDFLCLLLFGRLNDLSGDLSLMSNALFGRLYNFTDIHRFRYRYSFLDWKLFLGRVEDLSHNLRLGRWCSFDLSLLLSWLDSLCHSLRNRCSFSCSLLDWLLDFSSECRCSFDLRSGCNLFDRDFLDRLDNLSYDLGSRRSLVDLDLLLLGLDLLSRFDGFSRSHNLRCRYSFGLDCLQLLLWLRLLCHNFRCRCGRLLDWLLNFSNDCRCSFDLRSGCNLLDLDVLLNRLDSLSHLGCKRSLVDLELLGFHLLNRLDGLSRSQNLRYRFRCSFILDYLRLLLWLRLLCHSFRCRCSHLLDWLLNFSNERRCSLDLRSGCNLLDLDLLLGRFNSLSHDLGSRRSLVDLDLLRLDLLSRLDGLSRSHNLRCSLDLDGLGFLLWLRLLYHNFRYRSGYLLDWLFGFSNDYGCSFDLRSSWNFLDLDLLLLDRLDGLSHDLGCRRSFFDLDLLCLHLLNRLGDDLRLLLWLRLLLHHLLFFHLLLLHRLFLLPTLLKRLPLLLRHTRQRFILRYSSQNRTRRQRTGGQRCCPDLSCRGGLLRVDAAATFVVFLLLVSRPSIRRASALEGG